MKGKTKVKKSPEPLVKLLSKGYPNLPYKTIMYRGALRHATDTDSGYVALYREKLISLPDEPIWVEYSNYLKIGKRNETIQ